MVLTAPSPPARTRPSRSRRPELVALVVSAVLGVLHLLLAPGSGTDLAAQLARASFARDAPLTPVDLSWYAGVHPYGYSLLAPWVMAVLGVGLTGLLAAVAASVLFARLVRDGARPVLASAVGAVFWVADVVSGRTTFALGAVAALAALVVLPRRRWAAALAVLSALLSPVAAAFLGLVAAVLVLHRRAGGWSLGVAATVPVLVLAVLFPGGGVQPFTHRSARDALLVAAALAVLTTVPAVRTGALLYAGAVAVLAFHEDPFGSNVLRLGLLVATALLLATSRRHPALVLAAAVAFLAWQVGPPLGDLRAPADPPTAALVAQLERVGAQRVEVLAPRGHRESADVAEKVPLARGWSRQLDYRENRLLYRDGLTGSAYRGWLLDQAVDHVAVPVRARLDFGSTRAGALVRAGEVPGLRPVWQDRDWLLLEVVDPRPIAAAPVQVVSSRRTELVLRADAAVAVPVRVRWSRWLSLSGPGCLERDGDGVRVRFRGPGTVVLGSGLTPRGRC